jgi:hypothetical protein
MKNVAFFQQKAKRNGDVARFEIRVMRLHIIGRGVELLGRWLREEATALRREMLTMKKLMLLTAVAILTVGATGCRSCDWFRRGAPASAAAMPMAPVYCEPCAATAAPCEPCSPCAASSPMMVAPPGPVGYPGN